MNWIIERAIKLRQRRDSGLGFVPEAESAEVAEAISILDEETTRFQRGVELEANRFLRLLWEKGRL